MSIDYLEELERQILTGHQQFVCPGVGQNEWHFADTAEALEGKAQNTARALRYETHIFRLVSKKETVAADSYLVVRKFKKAGPDENSRIEWAIVDTLDAAEMIRDVSQGSTPLFGAVIEKKFTP